MVCSKAPPGYDTAPFLPQSGSHRTFQYQMQSMQCPGQRTHHPIPHRASAMDLTDCQIKSRDPPPETIVQLCLVIQEVWVDILYARITHLGPFMSRRCRVVHRGTRFVTTIIDIAARNGLLHRAKCHNKLSFSNGWFITSWWYNPYQIVFGQFLQLLNSPLKLMCVSFYVQYVLSDTHVTWCCWKLNLTFPLT